MAERGGGGEGRGGEGVGFEGETGDREDAGVTTPPDCSYCLLCKNIPLLAVGPQHTRLDKYYFMYCYMNSETVITMFLFSSHTAEVDLGL